MEPLTMAAVSFGLQAIGSGLGFMGQQSDARNKNKSIRAQNQYNQQMHGYGERVKDFEYKNALKIYGMRQEQANLQVQEFQNAYKNYFFDEQMQLNQMIDQAKLASLQSNIKLAQAENASLASALNRGATGRRTVGRVSAVNSIMASMEGMQRAKQLSMNEYMMNERMNRSARTTNLRSKMAFNAIGPRPERAPSAPLPYMQRMDPGPNPMGLFAGLANSGASAFGTYGSLKAPSAGNIADAAKPPGATTGIGPIRNGALYGAAISE